MLTLLEQPSAAAPLDDPIEDGLVIGAGSLGIAAGAGLVVALPIFAASRDDHSGIINSIALLAGAGGATAGALGGAYGLARLRHRRASTVLLTQLGAAAASGGIVLGTTLLTDPSASTTFVAMMAGSFLGAGVGAGVGGGLARDTTPAAIVSAPLVLRVRF